MIELYNFGSLRLVDSVAQIQRMLFKSKFSSSNEIIFLKTIIMYNNGVYNCLTLKSQTKIKLERAYAD